MTQRCVCTPQRSLSFFRFSCILPFLHSPPSLTLQLMRYKYFSAGLLSRQDRYPDHIDTLEEQLTSGETVGPLREGSESLDVKVSE